MKRTKKHGNKNMEEQATQILLVYSEAVCYRNGRCSPGALVIKALAVYTVENVKTTRRVRFIIKVLLE